MADVDTSAEAVEPDTPSARWAANGEPDPHGDRYDCLRSDLPYGARTDDELANAVFLYDHRNGLESMSLTNAAKERIRWLSRQVRALAAERDAAVAKAAAARREGIEAAAAVAEADALAELAGSCGEVASETLVATKIAAAIRALLEEPGA